MTEPKLESIKEITDYLGVKYKTKLLWTSINLDETYPKEFLEYLHQMANDVMTGKVKTIPWTEKDAEEFKQLMSIEDDE